MGTQKRPETPDSASKVVSLDDYRAKPFIFVEGEEYTHFLDADFLSDIITGRVKASDLDMIDDLFAAIVQDWLYMMAEYGGGR